MTLKITKKQTLVLEYIRACIELNGFAPTGAEIAKGLGYKSANSAYEQLHALKEKGYINLSRNIARGISVVGDSAMSNKKMESALRNILMLARAGALYDASLHIADICEQALPK